MQIVIIVMGTLFLSTLSLRRATPAKSESLTTYLISIHALLAESDKLNKLAERKLVISIHALLAESDDNTESRIAAEYDFYPRSPCGERLMV